MLALLWDVRAASEQIAEFIEGLDQVAYLADGLRRSAVERQLEIIGEALNRLRRLDPEMADQIPEINRIIGLRNILAHGYATVDDDVVWTAASTRVPELRAIVRFLITAEQRRRDGSVLGDTVEVRVWFDGDTGTEDGVEPREALIAGEPTEALIHALTRTFGPLSQSPSVVVREGRATRYWVGVITDDVTLADAARLADGEVLQVDVHGRGGDFIPLVWDVVQAGLTIATLVQGGRAVTRALDRARTKRQRLAAQAWVDGGADDQPPMELRQAVCSEREWTRAEFDRFLVWIEPLDLGCYGLWASRRSPVTPKRGATHAATDPADIAALAAARREGAAPIG
ncbi:MULTISPECIES: HepT-like ribonuclease domain-containing protein [Microbacterium]|uniref:HepT-like ribonuclease domain-containing protein n=1 Tax=Microbacterium TaxID=33882 RepID=UPI00217E012B|nr:MULTISPECIES: HepT-like ribonuclease domain-containing protein [Microbacterium]UWF77872.1 DUF86 domain-containing protein [Microbacterium neungamense]WCM56048.1 DUF86 domain-containing protein [Microbacterium sp. EF45047]